MSHYLIRFLGETAVAIPLLVAGTLLAVLAAGTLALAGLRLLLSAGVCDGIITSYYNIKRLNRQKQFKNYIKIND